MATHRRFDRTARLLGDEGIARLAASRVLVVGVGGVGSHAAEALVRSGVGTIGLVDFDRVCVTNVNRQVHALKATLGKSKVAVMADRLKAINPDVVVEAHAAFWSPETAARLLVPEPDLVIDAIDNVAAKLHLIATCVRDRLRLVSSMGAAARTDPTQVRIADLSETRVDPLAKELRRLLRVKHDLDAARPLGVRAVYSEETPIDPVALAYDTDGFECVCPGGDNGLNDCDHRNRIEGSVAWVPAAFGLAAAACGVDWLLGRGHVFPRSPSIKRS